MISLELQWYHIINPTVILLAISVVRGYFRSFTASYTAWPNPKSQQGVPTPCESSTAPHGIFLLVKQGCLPPRCPRALSGPSGLQSNRPAVRYRRRRRRISGNQRLEILRSMAFPGQCFARGTLGLQRLNHLQLNVYVCYLCVCTCIRTCKLHMDTLYINIYKCVYIYISIYLSIALSLSLPLSVYKIL